MRRSFAIKAVALLMLLGAACGQSGVGESSRAQRSRADPAQMVNSLPNTVSLLAVPQNDKSVTGSGGVSPVGGGGVDGADDVLTAALTIYDAVPMADCNTNNPQRKQCIYRQSTESASRGIATFTVGDAAGIGGFIGVMGLDASGHWHSWFGTQNGSYHLLSLPGQMIVCAGGDALDVRSAADPAAFCSRDADRSDSRNGRAIHPDPATAGNPGGSRLVPAQCAAARLGILRVPLRCVAGLKLPDPRHSNPLVSNRERKER